MNKVAVGFVSLALFTGLSLMAFSGSSDNTTLPHLLAGAGFISTYQATPDAVLLDVRTPAEFALGHLDGAINIDFENPNFTSEIQKLDKKKPYFLYCRSGNRSGQATAILKREGFEKVYDLQGGVVGNQNLTLVPSS